MATTFCRWDGKIVDKQAEGLAGERNEQRVDRSHTLTGKHKHTQAKLIKLGEWGDGMQEFIR